ncbi:MAG TPA: hypothetical protein VJT31_26635 [Rugosimonospora sp.]|nr:hypothetical protein [Rugosimonospora sp.]
MGGPSRIPGDGPYRYPDPVVAGLAWATVVGGAVALLLIVVTVVVVDKDIYRFVAAPVLVCLLCLATPTAAVQLITQDVELRLDPNGFVDRAVSVDSGTPLGLDNASGTAVTVCAGIAGDCGGRAAGPARLRAPGVRIRPGWRVWVSVFEETTDLRLTIVGSDPAITTRDAVVHLTWDIGGSN